MDPEVLIFDSAQAAAEACGDRTLGLLEAAKSARGKAFLAVSGGTTPKLMFRHMAASGFNWSNIHFFWVDERCVPPDDDQSNYKMTREALLDHIKIDEEQVHRIQGEIDPNAAATMYGNSILTLMSHPPVFDVIQRGMGPDAHTASLFPGEPRISDEEGITAALWVEKMKQHRVTLLPGILKSARATLCLVSGKEKADALRDVLKGPRDASRFPAQIASANMTWFADRAAATEL
jgi:6-phosphogluconolactonase